MSRLINSVEAVERINKVTVANIRAVFAGKPINVVSPVEGGERCSCFRIFTRIDRRFVRCVKPNQM